MATGCRTDGHIMINWWVRKGPEEMYLISYGGMLVLSDVFKPPIVSGDWVSEEAKCR